MTQQQQREAMTQETSASQPAGGPDAPGGTPYPDIAGTSHATAAAAAFFRSFFTAKTSRDVEATHAHFHPGKTAYFDATLGWALPANADVRKMWEQYMPQWPAGAKSYPTQILGDITSAVVFVTDTPELFGGGIRTISIADLEDGKIVRLVDYWDGRGFGTELAGSLRVPADSYPHDLGASTVTSRPGPVATAARELSAALGAGDTDRAAELFSYDAVFEDMALRAQLRGQAAIMRYLRRALPGLPTRGHRSGTWPAPARAADTNGAPTASQLPSARPRSSSARTARSPSSPSSGTAPCSTTPPSPPSPPARSTGDPAHSIRLALASTSCGVTPATIGEALVTVGASISDHQKENHHDRQPN
jgi:hypothetical protein